MDANKYQELALKTLNKAVTCPNDMMINGVMGLCGESGEVIDIVKKSFYQGHNLDRDALIKELGDVAWYLALIAEALGITLNDIFEGNIEKLKERYPNAFEVERSVHRDE